MKKCVSVLLSITLIALTAVFGAGAQEVSNEQTSFSTDAPAVIGNVCIDEEINIIDVVCLQFFFAQMEELDDSQLSLADADLNETVDIVDVTHIQRYLAHIECSRYIGMPVDEAKALKKIDDEQANLSERERQIIQEIESFTRSKGVDISEFNGSVDMNKLKAAGYDFVIIRLGYGDDETAQDDKMFETNVKNAEAAGLDWGAYIYSYALSVNEAKSEVNHTLRLLRGKHPTMPIAFDWEDDSYKDRMGMPSDAVVREIARTYVNGIGSAGYYPMIYTGYSWLKGAFNDDSLFSRCDIWFAQWNTEYDYHDRPIGMWQYGGETNYIESPYISGLNGMFDKNYSYKNYPMIIKAYGYNNHIPLISSYASTGGYEDDIVPESESENLPPECNGVMGDSLRNQ